MQMRAIPAVVNGTTFEFYRESQVASGESASPAYTHVRRLYIYNYTVIYYEHVLGS